MRSKIPYFLIALALQLTLNGCFAERIKMSVPERILREANSITQRSQTQPVDPNTPVPHSKHPFPIRYNPPKYGKTLVIAHRGYSAAAPENTLSALKAAIEAGADSCEMDFHLTKDGEIVAIHDSTLDRTTNGKGDVSDFTLEEIRRLDAGSWFSPRYTGERIPTLEEVLATAKGRITMTLEIKTKERYRLPVRLVNLLSQYNMIDRVLVTSFYETPIKAIKFLNPDIPTATLVFPWQGALKKALDWGVSTTQPDKGNVTLKEVEAIHQKGLQIHVWTVDQASEWLKLNSWGVDGILTNQVRALEDFFSYSPERLNLPAIKL
jgi:glycerophosphoryl diester phosphodiesterase